MSARALATSLLLSLLATRASAQDEFPAEVFEQPPLQVAPPESEQEPRPGLPPGVDYPQIDDVRATSFVYADFTVATTSDLSTLPWVQGSGENYRLAVGARYSWGGFRLQAELPFQVTRLHIDLFQGGVTPVAEDREKSAAALGDLLAGGAYVHRFAFDLLDVDAGAALRLRLPTHTTYFTFGRLGGGTFSFGFPYYLHVAPSFLLGLSKGTVGFITNQGALAMYGKDATVDGMYFVLPTVYFWESHYALWVAPASWLSLSTEIESFIQLNRVTTPNFEPINDIHAVFVTPGVVLRSGDFWLALAGRIGIGKGARDFGVITFAGTNALMVRIGHSL